MAGEHLHGYLSAEFGVAGAIYLAHTPGADGGQDFIEAEFVAGREWHMEDSAKCNPSRIVPEVMAPGPAHALGKGCGGPAPELRCRHRTKRTPATYSIGSPGKRLKTGHLSDYRGVVPRLPRRNGE